MSKLKEIIEKHNDSHRFLTKGSYEVFEDVLKEYAEYYANECLKLAAQNVKFEYGYMDIEGFTHKEIVDLDYEQTFNFILPKHEEL